MVRMFEEIKPILVHTRRVSGCDKDVSHVAPFLALVPCLVPSSGTKRGSYYSVCRNILLLHDTCDVCCGQGLSVPYNDRVVIRLAGRPASVRLHLLLAVDGIIARCWGTRPTDPTGDEDEDTFVCRLVEEVCWWRGLLQGSPMC